MRSRLTVFVLFGVSIAFGLMFARQAYISRDWDRQKFETRKLKILTYATFMSQTGPGPEIVAHFKKQHKIDVEVVTSPDAGLLLERLKIGEAQSPFDLVIGIDQMVSAEAEARFKWREMFFGNSSRHPVLSEYSSKSFVPYDWSPMTFVFRKGDFPVPAKFQDLLDAKHRGAFALQDPRASTPGLQFYNWVKTVKRDDAARFLADLKPNVNSVSPSWALSYGLFNKEQVRFVFSYLTSLAFHWGVDGNRDFRVVSLAEGHPVQVEYVGVPLTCRECELAEEFVKTMLQPEAQKAIMEKNFMFPVINGLEEDTVFGELPRLKTIRIEAGRDFGDWDKAFKN